MPVFPQYQNAVLVENGNFVTHTAASTAAITAVSGDVHVINSAATGWPVTLPPVGLGGPVKVIIIHATGTAVVSPTETAGVSVNGGTSHTVPAGGTGAAATTATFVSDGSANWYS